MRTFKFISLFLCVAPILSAQTVEGELDPVSPISEKEKILSEIDQFEKSEDVNLSESMSQMSERISIYADARKKECTGEYSSIEITPEGESKRVENRLTKEEKKLCLLELIKLRKSFANALFNVREKLLKKQHRDQLDSLEEQRGETLKELDTMAAKLK